MLLPLKMRKEDKEDKGVLVRVVQDKDKWTRRSLGTL